MIITGRQVREARSLLGWSIPTLSVRAALSAELIRKFEVGKRHLSRAGIDMLRLALEVGGVQGWREAEDTKMTITAQQCIAARNLLDWPRSTLARKSRLSEATIRNLEGGRRLPSPPSVLAIRRAFESARVEFIDEQPGVRLRNPK
jgi:ribosome-binding protein aMBF1 (putative translation factor)